MYRLIILLLLCLGCDDNNNNDNGGSSSGSTQPQTGGTQYKGTVSGKEATGPCSFEDNRNVGGTLGMSCIIKSGQFTYSFNGEMINDLQGFADMTEAPTGDRVRVQIDWSEKNYPPASFLLTVNPFGQSTQYKFTKQ